MLKQGLKIGFILLMALVACDKSGNFPDQPVITFKSAEIVEGWDSILQQPATYCTLTIGFTDGDGDIGVVIDSTTDNNLLVDYYELKNNSWDTLTEIDFSSKIPVLTPEGQNKSLTGDISLEVNIDNRGSDSIQFEMQLLDRSGNASNIIATDIIVVE